VHLLYAISHDFPLILDLVSSCVGVLAAIGISWLSFAEHRFSVRPSSSTTLYLMATMLLDLVYLTFPESCASRASQPGLWWITVGQLCARLAMLLAECQSKETLLIAKHHYLSPEETAGILSRTFFWWMNPLLVKGTTRILTINDLPTLDKPLAANTLRTAVLRSWDQRGLSPSYRCPTSWRVDLEMFRKT
jgi:ATP-binding cassette, subfamily C (CFTR/MRP), member 1